MSFNLVDERWIPVLRDGRQRRVSLRAALTDAHQITALAPGFPAQTPAILRQVLLPVVLDAGVAPTSRDEWAGWFSKHRFTDLQVGLIETYLDKWRGRFDLFDPERPFGQVAGLTAVNGETKSVAQLIAPISTGNNVPLLTAFTEADDLALAPQEAALWMLHAQCWDTAGIKTGAVGDSQARAGKTTGNRTGLLGGLGVVVPTGRSLFDTILLNLPIRPDGAERDDEPQWRRDLTAEWTPRPATGLLDLMTWQSRRIRLIPQDTEHGTVVNRIVITAGDRITEVPEWEPHTLWRRSAAARGQVSVPGPQRHAPGRASFRGLDALISLHLPSDGEGVQTSRLLGQLGDLRAEELIAADYPVNVEVHGFKYGTQSAIFEDNIFDSLPLPVLALTGEGEVRDAVLALATQAGALETAINILAADLRRAAGGDPMPWDRGQRPGTMLVHALDPIARWLLGQLREATDADRVETLLLEWENRAHSAATRIAAPLLEAQPPDTFAGRDRDGRAFRLATAERGFHRRLNDILTRAADARTIE